MIIGLVLRALIVFAVIWAIANVVVIAALGGAFVIVCHSGRRKRTLRPSRPIPAPFEWDAVPSVAGTVYYVRTSDADSPARQL
jgi:hypothetical protein